MLLLLLFALIAGAGTAITPCVLPVVPALLSASSLGGRRRPIGIVVGLALTFTIAIVALAQLVKGVGLASGAARSLAIIVLIVFGIVLLIPELAERMQAPLSRLARFGPKTRGDGFWSGILVGGALGFVCAPCAGPILAAVTSVSASSGATAQVVAVALAYAVGLSSVMLLYGLGGRAVLDRVRRHTRGHVVERTLGAVLLLTGVLMVFNVDVRFEEDLAKDTSLPSFLIDPTRSLETSNAVSNRLASLRPPSRFAERQQQEASVHAGRQRGRRLDPRGQDPTAAQARPGPELHRHSGLVQHAGEQAADDGRAARSRGAGRLLDLHVHQLHPHAAVRQGAVRHLPQVRPRRRRRRDARVHVRAGGRQRPPGDPIGRDPLPGRPGQPLRHLERIPERVLAGRVLHRRPGPDPPHQVRRGQLQGRRGRRPPAAVRGRSQAPAAADDGHRDHAFDRARDSRDLPRSDARPGLRAAAASRACTSTPGSATRH